jgi:hypothetical protein
MKRVLHPRSDLRFEFLVGLRQTFLPTLQGFHAQNHENFRLLKEPMTYSQSIPAKTASKSIGLRLSLNA